MELGLAVTSSAEVQDKSPLIYALSDELSHYFKDKQYGSDIKSITIGIRCLNVPPGFEKFSKLPKPKYTKGKKTINPDGIPFTFEDSFEYSIKLDFDTFKNASEAVAKKILSEEISKSLSVLDDFKSQIKNFEAARFKLDMESFLKKY